MRLAQKTVLNTSGNSHQKGTMSNAGTSGTQHSNIVLIILCLAVFMAGLDLFIINMALNHIGQDIGQSSLSNLSWVLNGYAIFFAALLVPAGRLVDRYGRKAGFLTGMVVFTCASVGCALSVNLWLLIMFRCIQAAGAAILTPSSLGLLLTAMPSERITSSVRIWASSSSLAGAAGPVIGGLLVNANCLPRHQTATGSAIVNMSRQIGTVLGTSILVIILGTATANGLLHAFIHVWWFTAALSSACVLAALGITPRRREATTARKVA
jgi:MFS family permease